MVQKEPKKRGRPRAFDLDDVLDKAVQVFWQHGFEGSSLDDLTGAMGLNRPSLYAAFGDKEALFLQCLARYSATVGGRAMQALHEPPTAREAVAAFLRQSVINATSPDGPRGCLVGSVAAAVDLDSVRQVALAGMTGAELAKRLQAAVDAGELPADFPVRSRARRLADSSMSLALRARAGAPREELLEDAADAAALAFVGYA